MSTVMRRLALIAASALALAGCGQQTGAVSGEQVRAYLLEHPEVIEEALTKLQEKRLAAADDQLAGVLKARRAELERDPRDPVIGNPNGKITVVEFFDYRCSYCKAAGPHIDKLLAENKDIRLVLKEYPILSPASEAAARAALGAQAQGKYWPVHQALMQAQTIDDPTIMRILAANGVDVAKAAQIGGAPKANDMLEDVRELARLTGVNGTPAFIIGDKVVAGWDPNAIEAAIKAARAAS